MVMLAAVSDASSGHLRRCSDDDTRVMLAAVSDASSGHLRRCSDADTVKLCLTSIQDTSILSWTPMMGQQKQ
eukprot:scaffold3091_cov88-Skeletonema_dohrnii-CCMP3373.AAC.1